MLNLETQSHPAAWRADAMHGSERWTVRLSQAQRDEIIVAARALAASGTPVGDIPPDVLARGRLRDCLADASRELSSGRGFVLLRDFPLDELPERDASYAYAALGRYLGRVVAQNRRGDVLGKVMDANRDWRNDPTARGYQTRMHMDFHSDSCDLVGLLCIQPAKSGGLSAIVSSVAIYNHMREHSPDLVEVLCKDLYYDRRGEEVGGAEPYYRTALFHEFQGSVFNRYCREYIESAQRFDGVPRLDDRQRAAMDEFDRLCHSPEFILHMDFRRGDIQLLNNHVILHSRTAFEDHDDPARKRLLWRLYINNRADHQRPACYQSRFSDPDKWALSALVS